MAGFEVDIQGVLFPNLITMLVQLCSTIVLFLLCKKLLWKPAREILRKRQERIDNDFNDAENSRNDALKELENAKENLENARNKSNEIIDSARKEANELKNNILANAKQEANNKIKQADAYIEQEKLNAKKEIHDEMVNVAMMAVNKLLNDKATLKDDEEAIEKYIDEVNKKWV